ncbi:MAG: hypothetical protein KDD70_17815, partial [Bdellovibrionales bacterium]|nr:hypothetical protein [Bdellovibrionales bacterium]
MRRYLFAFFTSLLFLAGALTIGTTASADEPRLIHKLLFNGRGSQLVRFGDLNGDGTPEVVTAQVAKRQITAIIAMNLQGDTLWQIGKPDPRNYDLFSDLPLQLFDLDSDGKDEVFFIKDGQLTIADGNGIVLKSRPVKGDDALFIQRFGPENALRILVKDRYRQFWIYNSNLKFLWS